MARKRINQFIVAYEKGSVPPFPTVVERLITPNPEKGFVPVNRVGLRDEILTMISAGNDTTGITTMVGLFNILYNPQIHARLLEELKTILPKPDSRAKYLDIEKLPYLVCLFLPPFSFVLLILYPRSLPSVTYAVFGRVTNDRPSSLPL